MGNLIETDLTLINDKIKFSSVCGEKSPVITDYIPPLGEGKEYLPLELFLISFSTCVGGTVLPLLRKFGKTVQSFTMHAKGYRRETHPTGFEKIELTVSLVSPDATIEDLQKAVQLSEDRFCPVWAMIKGNVDVTFDCRISAE